MKSISLKMSKNFKIEPLCKNNVYELENNSALVDIECEVDSTLTYKMHISHGGTKSFVVMTKNESSISTMLTAPILNSNGVYYIQIEGIKTDYRIVSNQIRFEAGSFINAESIPTPSQQGVIDQILIRLDAAEGNIEDLEDEKQNVSDMVNYYTKTEVDTSLALKQNVSDMRAYSEKYVTTYYTDFIKALEAIGEGLVKRYSTTKNYNVGDYCFYQKATVSPTIPTIYPDTKYGIYRCKAACRGENPSTSPEFWEKAYIVSHLEEEIESKQNTLVSGTNIKTINNVSLLGSGNIEIQGGSSDVTKAYVDQQDDAIRASIPTDVSDLNNDSGYLTPNTVGQYVPTKTSDLTNDSDFTTTEQVATQLDTKQNTLTAGANITIVDDVISATGSGGSTVTMSDNANAGVDLTVDGTSRTLAKSSELATVNTALTELTTSKQDKLIAGSGISIASDGKTISATVDDVQINGTSIVNNKVANIPIASIVKNGVVKIGFNSVELDETGHLSAKNIAPTQYIRAKENNFISKGTLDHRLALKQDNLTAGQGITITDNVISTTGDVTKALLEQGEKIESLESKVFVEGISKTLADCTEGKYYSGGVGDTLSLVDNSNSIYIMIDVSNHIGKNVTIGVNQTYNGTRKYGFCDENNVIEFVEGQADSMATWTYNNTTSLYEGTYVVTSPKMFFSYSRNGITAVSIKIESQAGYYSPKETDEHIDKAVSSSKNFNISFDDCIFWTDLIDNANEYTSAFQNSFLADLKAIHEDYGTKFSLFCFTNSGNYDIANVPNKFAVELGKCSSWLRFGYHQKTENGTIDTMTDEELTESYTRFTNAIYRLCGTTDSICRLVRLGSYAGSLAKVKILRDLPCGLVGLLTSHDSRDNYYLDAETNAYMQTHAKYFDATNQITFVKTTWNIDNGNAPTSGYVNMDYWVNVNSGNFTRYLEFFGHQYNWGVTGIKGRVESFSRYASENGFNFCYYEDLFKI